MRILFVDDMEERHKTFRNTYSEHQLDCVFNVDDALTKLRGEAYEVVFLDHDMSIETINGAESTWGVSDGTYLVGAICEEALQSDATFIIHSLNIPAGKAMVDKLQLHNYEAHQIPFAWVNNVIA